MKKQIIILFFFSLCFNSIKVFSQESNDSIIAFDSINGFYKFNPEINFTLQDIINNPSSLRLSTSYGFILLNNNLDELGYTHYRYLQTYNNVPIENSMFIVTDSIGKLLYGNGFLIKNLNLSSTPSITANDAVTSAISTVNATTYFWQDSIMENSLKQETNNPDTTFYPIAQLIIAKTDLALDNSPQNFRLCYKVPIIALVPRASYDLYIDAITGALVRQTSASYTCFGHQLLNCDETCIQADANTLYYGSQYIFTDRITHALVLCDYRTKNTCTGTYLFVVKANGDNFFDGTNNWTDNNDKPGTTSLWCLERAHDYYRFTFGRNSYDGNYSQIKVYAHDVSFNNAEWDPDGKFLHMGVISGNDLTTLDIQGHELTHGITQATANLGGSGTGEQGALNESFSDIFGTMIEFYAKSNYNANGPGNYQVGEDAVSGCGVERSMSDPKSFCQPDAYQGQNWSSQNEVHINDGVQNYWFYLLAEGGTGNIDDNPSNQSYCVDGIGKDKAARIAYLTLTTKLFPGVNYYNVRFYSIQSAQDLFGANSNEVAQVTQAWYAVGVGPSYSGNIEINNYTVSGTESIQNNNAIVFNNLQVPSGTSLTVTSDSKITMNTTSIASSGSYFHAYIAPGCTGGAKINNSNVNNNYSDYFTDQIKINKTDTNIITNNSFLLTPNPNNGNMQVTYEIPENTTGAFEVYSLIGEKLFSYSLFSGNNTFSISRADLNQGIYFYRAIAGNKLIASDKIVIIK